MKKRVHTQTIRKTLPFQGVVNTCLFLLALCYSVRSASACVIPYGPEVNENTYFISDLDIEGLSENIVGSGNGTLDWRLFTYSGSEIKNDIYDNGNNDLAKDVKRSFFDESFITTAAELKDYFLQNFDDLNGQPGEIEIVLFLDLNETGEAGMEVNYLNTMQIVVNPDWVSGNPNPFGDVESDYRKKSTSGNQSDINQNFFGGTVAAQLDSDYNNPYNLPVQQQGAGWADYAIHTGIDPFTLEDDDTVLINFSMSELNSGAEELFLSGTYSANDLHDAIPEPMAVSFIGVGGIGLLGFKRFFRRNRTRRVKPQPTSWPIAGENLTPSCQQRLPNMGFVELNRRQWDNWQPQTELIISAQIPSPRKRVTAPSPTVEKPKSAQEPALLKNDALSRDALIHPKTFGELQVRKNKLYQSKQLVWA